MAEFKCAVAKITVEKHPDPEVTRLEVGRINDYRVVVLKDAYKTGDKIVYIPEQAIVPNDLIEKMGLVGRLAGSAKNRVKAIKLRKVLSQGLVFVDDAIRGMELGADASEYLGVKKYEPTIPENLTGQMSFGGEVYFKFDVQNIKQYPHVLVEGEEVIFTEKLHGTFSVFMSVAKEHRKDDMFEKEFFVSSKGQAAKGLYFLENEMNMSADYVRVFKNYSLAERIRDLREILEVPEDLSLTVLGEIYGIQKGYGYGTTANKPLFRVFGIKIQKYFGEDDSGVNRYVNWSQLEELCLAIGLDTVPVLYKGPFLKEELERYTSGKETVTGKAVHIREGVVVYVAVERKDDDLGRVMLKSVSEEYLLGSDGEEFN